MAVAGVFGKALQISGNMAVKTGSPNYDAMLDMVNKDEFEKN